MTDNPPAVADGFVVRRSIDIAAGIDRVWAAVTQPDLIAQWFGDRCRLDSLEVGAGGAFGWDDAGDFPFRIEEFDPPRAIAYRWSNAVAGALDPLQVVDAHSTLFRFTLEERPGGTRLTVVETGFESHERPDAVVEDHRQGWTSELDELVALVEGAA
ncbi:SRPBCC family protein [Agromyces seonyuensis]|nr:SRPBCC family protein [Agromyces seonyuensis]